MTTIATFATRGAAERERRRFVAAQRLVDRVSERLFGETVEPPAEEVFQVVVENKRFVLTYQDPSIKDGKEQP